MNATEKYAKIVETLNAGGTLQVSTYGHSWLYHNASMVKLGGDGLYIQRGKQWDFAGGAKLALYATRLTAKDFR
ncbi:MAG TPA: hypothetical protein VIR57_21285 [Chloroflexota bacterium]|jgi:hypothetical protein